MRIAELRSGLGEKNDLGQMAFIRFRLKLRRLEEELTDRGVAIPPISDSASKSDREDEPEVNGGTGNIKSAAERFGPKKLSLSETWESTRWTKQLN